MLPASQIVLPSLAINHFPVYKMDSTERVDDDNSRPLNVPHVDIVRYGRTFLRMAVCELRFPTLFELDQPRPPTTFATALRRLYPLHEVAQTLGLGDADVTRRTQHEFRTQAKDWVVTLKQDAVSLQTSAYTTFEDFLSRLKVVIAAATPVIDSPFFTRVGLRYVNHLPFRKDELLNDWINSDLVGALTTGLYGRPHEYLGRVIGRVGDGQYVFQHGFKVNEDFVRTPTYAIDCDMSQENVETQDVATLLPKLNQHAFNLFHWALGPKAKNSLTSSIERS